MAVLYGNNAFSILVLSTKKRNSSFLKKVFVLQKICFKITVLKTFKISTDGLIKTCRSRKRRAILKIPSTVFFEESMLFLLALNEESMLFLLALTLNVPIPDKVKKIKLNFYFHTSLWCLKRFYEGL